MIKPITAQQALEELTLINSMSSAMQANDNIEEDYTHTTVVIKYLGASRWSCEYQVLNEHDVVWRCNGISNSLYHAILACYEEFLGKYGNGNE